MGCISRGLARKVFSQVAGTDFGSTCTLFCRILAVRTVLAIAANRDWDVLGLAYCTYRTSSTKNERASVRQATSRF